MSEVDPIVEAELEVFRQTLPEEDRNEIRDDGIPWDVVKGGEHQQTNPRVPHIRLAPGISKKG